MAEPASGQEAQRVLVVFRLADEFYGLDVHWVQEIVAWQPVTPVPRTASFIEGIVHLRGRIIPVLDVRSRCGLPPGQRGAATRILVTEMGSVRAGLVVDSVSEVARVPAGAIRPPAQVLAIDRSFVEGIVHHRQRWVIVLRPDRILAAEEQEVLMEVAAAAGETSPVETVETAASLDPSPTSAVPDAAEVDSPVAPDRQQAPDPSAGDGHLPPAADPAASPTTGTPREGRRGRPGPGRRCRPSRGG